MLNKLICGNAFRNLLLIILICVKLRVNKYYLLILRQMILYCADLAVSPAIMQHVVKVESSGNPYAIGVVGGKLQRQPRNISEAIATAKMLEQKGYNFSLGLAQVNRYNLKKYGLNSYEQAFQICPNLKAGSYILKECYDRAKDWGKSFSCYYSGNFVTGYRHGYVQKIFASMGRANKPVLKLQHPLVADLNVLKPINRSQSRNANVIIRNSQDSNNSRLLKHETLALGRGSSKGNDSGRPGEDTNNNKLTEQIQSKSKAAAQDNVLLPIGNSTAADSAFVF